MRPVLVIEDNLSLLESIETCLEERGIPVEAARTAGEGLRSAMRLSPSVILLDIKLPDGSGLSVLKELRTRNPFPPVVVMTGFPSSDTAIEAMRMGASDYLPKPVGSDRLLEMVERFCRRPGHGVCELRPSVPDADLLVGKSPAMIEVFKAVGRVARCEAPVLLRGETGTGKDLVARAIHGHSGRRGAFVAVNCSAVVETLAESELFGHERGAFTGAVERRRGRFEMADDGTLFLDEIGDAPPAVQVKLLRVLDRGEFERVGGREVLRPRARIVAATNRDLEQMVRDGRFRGDLYFRLNVMSICLPPLRERREDIPLLVTHFIQGCAGRVGGKVDGVSRGAMQRLLAHSWPGNVRELENALSRAAINAGGGIVGSEHLPVLLEPETPETDGEDRQTKLSEVEQVHIEKVLRRVRGNRGRACEILGITRPTLRRKMREYGL